MRKSLVVVLSFVLVVSAAKKMRIHLSGDNNVSYSVAQIDSITFVDIAPSAHADVIVCWADVDSIFIADSAGNNGRVIPLPFSTVRTPDVRQAAIGSGYSEYCFYIEWRNTGENDTLYIMDDLSGTNLRKIPQSYQETLRDISFTPSGDIVLVYYNGRSDIPVFRLPSGGTELSEVFNLGDDISNVHDIDFDAQGKMYVVDHTSRVYRFPSEEGGVAEELHIDALVSDPDNPEFTQINSIDIDRATGIIYMDANYVTMYSDHDIHYWITTTDFSGTGSQFTGGFNLDNSGGDFLQSVDGETFFVYEAVGAGGVEVYSDFTDPNSGTQLFEAPNIRDITVREQ